MHGGGMGIFSAEQYATVAQRFAHQGLCVVCVEFRNSPVAPFPAGLEDCYTATTWALDNQERLGTTSQLIVGGDSGGGNLAISTALLSMARGTRGIQGVYVMCPHLTNHNYPFGDLDGYMGSRARSDTFDRLYVAEGVHTEQWYLAFPGQASVQQLRGLPPVFMVLNEYDPTKYEGKSC